MKLPQGDMQQISELRGQWEYYFNKKNEFLNKIAKRALNADQKLEAEMYLIELTGTIKSIDRKIHNIMFGASERVEERPYSMQYLFGDKHRIEESYRIVRIEKMYDEQIRNLKRELKQKSEILSDVIQAENRMSDDKIECRKKYSQKVASLKSSLQRMRVKLKAKTDMLREKELKEKSINLEKKRIKAQRKETLKQLKAA